VNLNEQQIILKSYIRLNHHAINKLVIIRTEQQQLTILYKNFKMLPVHITLVLRQ